MVYLDWIPCRTIHVAFASTCYIKRPEFSVSEEQEALQLVPPRASWEGYFLHLDDVLEWFEAVESHWKKTSQLNSKDYDPILKEALQCWRCDEVLKTVPVLKDHLKDHFEADIAKAKKKQDRLEAVKRKRDAQEQVEAEPDSQKRKEEK